MTIETIFEIVKDALASIKYEEEPKNAFEYLFDLWSDIEYLEAFFETHKTDLAEPFWKMTVENAIDKTLNEVDQFKRDIIRFAEKGKKSSTENLDDNIFKPLSKTVQSTKRVQSKAYGKESGVSILRIYAIRLGPNCYIVTGGAIKLTKRMEEREHTKIELEKLKRVSEFLKALDIDNENDYGYLDFSTS